MLRSAWVILMAEIFVPGCLPLLLIPGTAELLMAAPRSRASAVKHAGAQAASQCVTEGETKRDRDVQPVLSNFSAASTS